MLGRNGLFKQLHDAQVKTARKGTDGPTQTLPGAVMNPNPPSTIVLLGFLSHFPVAGVAWQTIHYLVGLQRLGYDVYYVEAHGCTPSMLMQSETDDGPRLAAEYIEALMRRFGFERRWAYHALYPDCAASA